MSKRERSRKPLHEWTYKELVDYIGGRLAVSLFNGEFRDEVSVMCDLVLEWKKLLEQKRRTDGK